MSTYRCTITRYELDADENGIDVEIPITINYTFHGFCAGATDGRYGPPIEPSEPAHIEIDGYSRDDGLPIELTAAELRTVEREIGEELAERMACRGE